MVRTTYFVQPDAEDFSSIEISEHQKGLHLHGLNAARHRRAKTPNELLPHVESVNIEFCRESKRISMLPFDPPTRLGLFVYASLDSDPDAVSQLVQDEGFIFDQQEYRHLETEDYFYWFVPVNAVELKLDADSLRLSLSSERVFEEWHHYQPWNEFVAQDGEIGVFTIENKLNSMVLSGRVRSESFEPPSTHASDGTKLTAETFGEPMLLRWYPKYQTIAGSSSAYIEEPYGLHPSLRLSIEAQRPASLPSCRLFTQVDLPSDLFLDRYELEDLVRAEPPAQAVAIWGDNDLEKPRWHVSEPVSALFQLFDDSGVYKLPLHFRYQRPGNYSHYNGSIMAPYVFWACRNDDLPAQDDDALEPHQYLGTESAFPIDNTQFFVVPMNDIPFKVPVISAGSEDSVEVVTTLVVCIGFLLVLASILYKALLSKSHNAKVKKD